MVLLLLFEKICEIEYFTPEKHYNIFETIAAEKI